MAAAADTQPAPSKNEILSGLKERPGGPTPIYLTRAKTGHQRSKLWKQFHEIFMISDERFQNPLPYIECQVCKQIFGFNGTTIQHLRHLEGCTPHASSQQKLGDYYMENPVPSGSTQHSENLYLDIPMAIRKQVTNACVDICCKDLKPFSVVEGEGFVNYSQVLLEIGYTLGKRAEKEGRRISIQDVLPARKTVASNVHKNAKELRSEIRPVVSSFSRKVGGACTTDLWTEPSSNESFISLSFSCIDEDFRLREWMLETAPFRSGKKTAVNIESVLMDMIQNWRLHTEGLCFVTDEGANVLAAIRPNWRHISCAGHVINTVLRCSFDQMPRTSIVTRTLEDCKNITTVFKKSELMSMLVKEYDGNTLKQEATTRWLSRYACLTSMLENFDAVETILQQYQNGKYQQLTEDLDKHVLEEIVGVLRPFQTALVRLQASKEPTLHLVLAAFRTIEISLELVSGEASYITALKLCLQGELIRKDLIKTIHVVAAVLFPKYRNLPNNLATSAQKKAAYQWINDHMPVLEVPSRSDIPSPPKRKRDGEHDEFDSDEEGATSDTAIDQQKTPVNELSAYLETKFTSQEKALPVLEFWKQYAIRFPRLATLARKVLAIPATSCLSEREFSSAGDTKTLKRNRLTADSLADILFLHHNKGNVD